MSNSRARLRIGWVGFHQEGLVTLDRILAAGHTVECVITLTPEARRIRSGAVDYEPLCRSRGIPLHATADINGPETVRYLADQRLDLLLVIGWSQILRHEALASLRLGAIGTHASLLPHNRGSAPVNWALIRGEQETGNSLIWLASEVDGGDLIDQVRFPISDYDSCATIYEHVAASNTEMILRLLPALCAGERPGRPQQHSDQPLLPRRRPADGLVNWKQSARGVYNFIRALTRPYPGAFSHLDGARYLIWRAAHLPLEGSPLGEAGRVLGKIASPDTAACGLAVACETGALLLLELETDAGEILSGVRLAELPWKDRIWRNSLD